MQDISVDRARDSIKSIIDIRPANARIKNQDGTIKEVAPTDVNIGYKVMLRQGERLCVDGILMDEEAFFDTSSITGESEPRRIVRGDELFSGFILLSSSAMIECTRVAAESEVERILHLVEDAAERKSKRELYITKFAKIYTPVVLLMALLLVLLPYLLSLVSSCFSVTYEYSFGTWLYRALMLLVVSCPCAIVISVPLSYYSGIGVAAKSGVLFKGANCIDELCSVNSFFFDKTGTLTHSSKNSGGISMAEEVKEDAASAVARLKELGVEKVTILSGDKKERVANVAESVGADNFYSELLPQEKYEILRGALERGECCAFVGDGINDAPGLRLANVGIAMGGAGSDAAVENADIVLQTDQPGKIITSLLIARKTRSVVRENIVGSLAIKIIVLVLGLIGLGSLWFAVFADTGVALLAVANSLRIPKNRY